MAQVSLSQLPLVIHVALIGWRCTSPALPVVGAAGDARGEPRLIGLVPSSLIMAMRLFDSLMRISVL